MWIWYNRSLSLFLSWQKRVFAGALREGEFAAFAFQERMQVGGALRLSSSSCMPSPQWGFLLHCLHLSCEGRILVDVYGKELVSECKSLCM